MSLLASACACTACAARVQSSPGANQPAAESSATPGAQPGTSSSDNSGARTRRTLGWVSLAVGGEAAVVAVVSSVMLLHDKSVLDGNCNAQKACNADGANAAGSIPATVPLNTISWIVAAAGVGTGLTLLLTSRPEASASSSAQVTLSPSGSGVALSLRNPF